MKNVELARITMPEFGLPSAQPVIPAATYAARMAEARRAAAAAGYDALVVYGDREHSANLAYLTAFDPRFEESLLILPGDEEPTLLLGNECMGYSNICPVPLRRVLYQSFSLINQPRSSSAPLETILRQAGIAQGQKVGVVGWKYFTAIEAPEPRRWLEIPAYIADTLRGMGCDLYNATDLFMHPDTGLRAVNDLDQLAYFEHAATWSSQGMRNMLFGLEPGMSEFAAMQRMGLNGLPTGFHPILVGGARAALGLASANGHRLERGDPMLAALGYWGSNSARAGFLAASADELPAGIRDYVDKLVGPFFRAVAEWYEHIGIGVPGGALYDIIHRHLGDPFFGVTLNPGHLIHLDEWVSSPIYSGSTELLKSGMAIQMDVIPGTGTAYFTTNVEDGIALADEALRAAFARRYPEAWARIQARRDFMQSQLGITLRPEVLPFSNIQGYLPPFWLAPQMAMRVH